MHDGAESGFVFVFPFPALCGLKPDCDALQEPLPSPIPTRRRHPGALTRLYKNFQNTRVESLCHEAARQGNIRESTQWTGRMTQWGAGRSSKQTGAPHPTAHGATAGGLHGWPLPLPTAPAVSKLSNAMRWSRIRRLFLLLLFPFALGEKIFLHAVTHPHPDPLTISASTSTSTGLTICRRWIV
ncbi:hypothetical protein ASPVEDRAFT_365669 [Aspergillus versicolor CBS 583.65]|uniref:Uncharacterized protein n=1 Tax=Aspergillus versicolor CBS 583.65 TaxID=1036611 RepID=A0A1L9Q0U8_ASPVE|nr:uncharacterized protein ASPVEDRAFT_365669 [Aspergillus versicolor CBS 583.65]OJJ07381.1 hypothetical protein ASPVEDRAFT_365669 [Aspergillus versicolor CBS 583.65]